MRPIPRAKVQCVIVPAWQQSLYFTQLQAACPFSNSRTLQALVYHMALLVLGTKSRPMSVPLPQKLLSESLFSAWRSTEPRAMMREFPEGWVHPGLA
jgi:hypothetical protein